MAERGTGFPRIGLSSAIQIMEAAQKFGKSWSKEQFAGFGAKGNAGSHKSGAFAARLSALRDYGLVSTDKESVSATELAQVIAKPINEPEREDSVRQAFLSVETFRRVYESLDPGTALPRDKFAEYAVTVLGVSRDSMDKFVNVFIDSGSDVGLVSYSKETKDITLIGRPRQNDDVPQHHDTSVTSPTALETEEDAQEVTQVGLFTAKQPVVVDVTDAATTAMNEQGVNHAGNGWGLTVLVKSGHRLPADLRKAIRDLLESADLVADKFYELEKTEE